SPFVLPLAPQRARALQDLNGLERLFQYEQLVRMPKALNDIAPLVIRMCRADHDLNFRVVLPEALYGLQPIPTWRHAHVHERYGVPRTSRRGTFDTLGCLLALEREIQRIWRQLSTIRAPVISEQEVLHARQIRITASLPRKHLAEVLVYGRV